MQLKWLEDFIVLAQERSFTRAAELRHVTHPAFGRRIRALEAWAGTPLVERGSGGPVTLTPAGQSFLETAGHLARSLTQSHEELQSLAGRQARTVTLATGRTLARTVVADWLVRLQPI
jgi:DNA-binding transcriptional LysR family regulator